MNELKEGQSVRIIPLGKTGVIKAFLGAKHCRVLVGGLEMKCKREDLRPIETKLAKKQKTEASEISQSGPKRRLQRRSIDLHGMTREQAIREVEQFLSDAIVDGLLEIEIIHGHGSGTLKTAVHEYLRSSSVVSHFSINPLNTGVTKVVL